MLHKLIDRLRRVFEPVPPAPAPPPPLNDPNHETHSAEMQARLLRAMRSETLPYVTRELDRLRSEHRSDGGYP